MVATKSYTQKLADPRWQLTRIKHLERTHSTCEDCGRKGPVDLHHRVYGRGCEPWEYPDDNFVVVCRPCHLRREKIADMSRAIFQVASPESAYLLLLAIMASPGPLSDTLTKLAVVLGVGSD